MVYLLINFNRDLRIPFPSKRIADIVFGTLSVDHEPKRGGVKRHMRVQESSLVM